MGDYITLSVLFRVVGLGSKLLKGGCIYVYIEDHCRVTKWDTRSLDYGSCGGFRNFGVHCREFVQSRTSYIGAYLRLCSALHAHYYVAFGLSMLDSAVFLHGFSGIL